MLLLSSSLVTGCGTIANTVISRSEELKDPFGGVHRDLHCIRKAANGEGGLKAHDSPEPYPKLAVMLLCTVDLPFSLVGDVVMWPYTVAYNYVNQPIPTVPVATAATPVTLSAPPVSSAPSAPPATLPALVPVPSAGVAPGTNKLSKGP
ncbi:YceK/YidQ family lipoprotein [Gemmata sp. JC717]|uniref:YceK/YidQ family lipoprotein n=1 Tax=Gemmata algarum TaxID=2975278 RepID=UPI0021BB5B34|nr:YceK/YidQ family lipoprotein [Gemmata algarum]MDY3556997.1 YceK/YidQ family lipoprotein [Gemmata algarum]